jgi:hypothetical protein
VCLIQRIIYHSICCEIDLSIFGKAILIVCLRTGIILGVLEYLTLCIWGCQDLHFSDCESCLVVQ